MQKRWLAILLAAMLTVSMTACGSGDTNNDSTSDKTDQNQTTGDQTANTGDGNSDVEYTEITLNIAGSAAESHPVSQGMLYWEKLVEERSGGAVQVEAFLNATFGTGTAIIESIQSGSVQLGEGSLSSFATFCPDTQYTGIPFAFDSREHAYAWTETEFAQALHEEVVKTSNMYILGWFENGIRMLSNNKHPVTCPDDLKGLKIRVIDSPIYIEMFTRMGASAMPMAYSEVYTALQQGTVDGQDNPYPTFTATKYYEVQSYFTDLSHTFDFTVFFIGNDVLESVNDATRELFIECGKEAEQYQHDLTIQEEDGMIKTIQDNGVEMYWLSEDERALFKEAVGDMSGWFAQNVDAVLSWDDFQASLEESRPA